MIDEQLKVWGEKGEKNTDTQEPCKISYFANLQQAYTMNFTKQRQCENMKEQDIAQPIEYFSFQVL